MKKTIFSGVFSLLSILVFAQKEDSQNCAKRNAIYSNQLKSNSLSLAQIAETEHYDVNYYTLDLAMTNTSTALSGTGEIYGTAREDLDSVLFELFSTFTISDLRLDGISTPYSRVGSAVKVPVNILTGESFVIAIDYNGTPPTQATNPLGGAGMTNASSPSWGNQVTWSLSEPFSAYEWWPCKQSLTDKADSLSVKVTVPSACKAGSNGMLENVVDLGNGTTRYEWKHNYPIDYYLVSVAVAEYVDYSIYANPAGAPGPVLIQNFIYDNPATLPFFQNDIDETVDFIELFADLYGPYPFDNEKYGHCMAPLSGGMEHQTMTTQGWFDQGLTAHELGHQWWGDNVTCASWADIWMNEGFASYSEYLMKENLYPGQTTSHMIDVHDNVMSLPFGRVWVEDSLNESRIFSGRLTYDKGAAIIHTFRFMVNNDSLFFQILQDFQLTFGDSTAHGIDMRDALATGSGIDFTNAFDEWYFGEGYPIYSARWNVVGNDLLLEVSHSTSSSTPTFTNPLELRFSRIGTTDTVIRVDIDSNIDQFLIPGMSNAANLTSVDPNNWIINDLGTITHDENFTTIVEELNSLVLKVYPNPSDGIFNIETNLEGEQELLILDSRGRKILSDHFSGSYLFDLGTLNSGYYLVHLTDQSGATRIRAIVKH